MVTEAPWMWIIGGPNGAGKTTLARAILGGVVPTNAFVNTDEIARTLGTQSRGSAMMAGRVSIDAVESHIASRTSFAVETTLSSRRYLHVIDRLRQHPMWSGAGWRFGLFYVGVAHVETSLCRIAKRVASGGHGVPEVDVRRRFGRSVTFLRDHASLCDRVVVFDNTGSAPNLLVDGWRGEESLRGMIFPWEQEHHCHD